MDVTGYRGCWRLIKCLHDEMQWKVEEEERKRDGEGELGVVYFMNERTNHRGRLGRNQKYIDCDSRVDYSPNHYAHSRCNALNAFVSLAISDLFIARVGDTRCVLRLRCTVNRNLVQLDGVGAARSISLRR